MKILITGGCGFIGSNLAIFLKQNIQNAKITSVDNLSRKGSSLNHKILSKKKIKNFKLNISKVTTFKKFQRFDLIIHCAAEPAIEASRNKIDEVFNSNLIGTFNILKKCAKDKSNIIYLEGYLFDLPEAKDIFYKVVDKAKENNYQVALSLSDPFCVERHRADFIKLIKTYF